MADIVPLRQGAIEADAPPEKVAYKPTKGDWQLVEAFQALIASSGRLSNDAIGNHLKVTGETVRKRLNKPGCRAWIDAQLAASMESARTRVVARATELAMRGSIDHMNFVAKVGGWFAQPEGGGAGGNGNTFNGPTFLFNSLVPRR